MASNEEGARKRRANVKSLLTAIVALAMLTTTAEVVWADTVVPNITITIIETPGVTIVPVVVGACETTNPTCLISAGGDTTPGEDTNFTVDGYTTQIQGNDAFLNIDILEPGAPSTVSDIVQIQVNKNGALYVQFVSAGSALFSTFTDHNAGLTVQEPAIGGPFELVPIGGFSGRFSGIKSFIVQSDPSTAVPEPSTLLLLSSGLAGLAAWRRRQS